MQAREWVIELSPFTELLTSNQRLDRWAKAARVKGLRQMGWGLARAQRIPHLDKIHAFGDIIVPDQRSRDANNWWPTFKALLDGVVDAGVLDNDDYRHVIGPDMRIIPPGEARWRKVYQRHLLVSLRIVEIEESHERKAEVHPPQRGR